MLKQFICWVIAAGAIPAMAAEFSLVDIVAAMYEKGERVLEGPEWCGRWEFRPPGHPYTGYTPGLMQASKEATLKFADESTKQVSLNGFARTAAGAEGWAYPLIGGNIDQCTSLTIGECTYYPGELACHPFNMHGEGFLISFTCDRDGDFSFAGTVRMADTSTGKGGADGIIVWTYDWNGRMENLNFIKDNETHQLAYGPAAIRKGETFVVRLDHNANYWCDATAFKLTFKLGSKTIPRRVFKLEQNPSQLMCNAIKSASESGTVANAVDAGEFIASFGYGAFESEITYPESLSATAVSGIVGVQTSSPGFGDLPVIGASVAETDIFAYRGNDYMKPVHPGEFYFHPGYGIGVVLRLQVKDGVDCANRALRVKLTDLNPIWGGKSASEHPACRDWSESRDNNGGDAISWGEAMRVYVNGKMRYEGALRDGTNANKNMTDIIADLASFDITDIKPGDKIELCFRALHDYQGVGIDCDATSIALEWGSYVSKGFALIIR